MCLAGVLAELLGDVELPEDEILGWMKKQGLITYPSPLLRPLLEELRDVFAAQVLPRLDPTDLAIFGRVGGASRAAVVASGIPRAGTYGGGVPLKLVCRVSLAAGLGQGERLPVGREDVCSRRCGRACRGPEVGAGSRLRLGRVDVRACR
jgi:hypothetical protein